MLVSTCETEGSDQTVRAAEPQGDPPAAQPCGTLTIDGQRRLESMTTADWLRSVLTLPAKVLSP